jgi:diguanylate cyclase (GGDEF)-like protein
MRNIIFILGRNKAVIAITLAAVLFSDFITILTLYISGSLAFNVHTFAGLFVATCAPLIFAPVISWFTIGLIFEIHELEEEMRLLATYDSLTGLLSRRAFMEQSNYICHFAERQGLEFTILVIDLDHFKKINDQYGHETGDKVLESFGKIMRLKSRESDLAGRIGGEEFAFFLPATTADKACNFAERLQKAIREDIIKKNNVHIRYTASIGLAYFSQTMNIEMAISQADKALYRAKRNGRNQTVIYSDDFEKRRSGGSLVNSA